MTIDIDVNDIISKTLIALSVAFIVGIFGWLSKKIFWVFEETKLNKEDIDIAYTKIRHLEKHCNMNDSPQAPDRRIRDRKARKKKRKTKKE